MATRKELLEQKRNERLKLNVAIIVFVMCYGLIAGSAIFWIPALIQRTICPCVCP